MTMQAIRDTKGSPWARVDCDKCGRRIDIRCEHAKAKGPYGQASEALIALSSRMIDVVA